MCVSVKAEILAIYTTSQDGNIDPKDPLIHIQFIFVIFYLINMIKSLKIFFQHFVLIQS